MERVVVNPLPKKTRLCRRTHGLGRGAGVGRARVSGVILGTGVALVAAVAVGIAVTVDVGVGVNVAPYERSVTASVLGPGWDGAAALLLVAVCRSE